jgi:hypothetical protein
MDNARSAPLKKIAFTSSSPVPAVKVSGPLDLASLPANLGVDKLLVVNTFQEHNSRICSTVLTCILWNVWKCRNVKVFRHEDETNLMISRNVVKISPFDQIDAPPQQIG